MTTDRQYHDSKQIDGIKLKICLWKLHFAQESDLSMKNLCFVNILLGLEFVMTQKEGKAINV